ncbi:DUF2786 domain-containing protein [Pseudonocardia dioxanivorans]|uniref:DUF2786 domain-containing protein n=1 Tax=Pseudonocardia dioxanivorans TaxID=240495 RepID=UPI00104926C6|nr:DUF2786 domain-containing protein [Pseudonocardia dioxanivorans]
MGRSRARAGWAARSVPPPGRMRHGGFCPPPYGRYRGRPGAGPLQGHGFAHYGRPVGPRVPTVLALLPLILIMAAPPLLFMGWATSGMIFPLLIFVSIAATGHRRRRMAAAQVPRVAARPVPPRAPQPPPWQVAKKRFDALRTHYAAYECDPMAVLRLPALCDVTVPSTARFVDAFAEAQALETDAPPPPEHARSFIAAVERADRAWRAAIDAAERIRLSNLTPEERGSVERIIKLLTTARDSDSEAERLAAYAKARSELSRLDRAGVIHLPKTAVAALDAESRGQLSA